MVKSVVFTAWAICCVNDTTRVGVNIFVICRNSDGKRLLLKYGLYLVDSTSKNIAYCELLALDGDVGGLGGLVEAIGGVITISTRSIGIFIFKHGKFVFRLEVLECRDLVATMATLSDKIIIIITSSTYTDSTVNKLLLREG